LSFFQDNAFFIVNLERKIISLAGAWLDGVFLATVLDIQSVLTFCLLDSTLPI
jgi:hypothetical protein